VPVPIRALSHDAGSTLLAVALLGLALGTAAAAFSILHATVLAPLPFAAQDRLALLRRTDRQAAVPVIEISYRHANALRARTRTFSDLAAFSSVTWDQPLIEPGPPVVLQLAAVSGTFFSTLQSPALLGRTLGTIDDAPDAPLTIVISHALWTQRFGSDPHVIGRSVGLGADNNKKASATIVGVMPRAFDFPRGADLWVPLTPFFGANHPAITGSVNYLFQIGRLRPDATFDDAHREMTLLMPQVAPLRWGNPTPVVTPLVGYLLGPSRAAVWAIFGLALLVWLLASANVSGLLLVQWSRRRHEIAIQRALGASTRHVVMPWLMQSAAMTIGAAIVAVAIAERTRRVTLALAGSIVPRLQDATLGTPVLLFGAIISAAAVLLAGALPAWQAARALPMDALKLRTGHTRSRVQRWLVVVELIVAIVTLAMAGRLVRAVLDLDRLDLGFQPQGVLTLDVQPSAAGTRGPKGLRFYEELLQRTRALPGVSAAGAAYPRPLRYTAVGLDSPVMLEGQTPEAAKANPLLNYETVTPGYFDAASIALRHGRAFTDDDRADAPLVALVGERTAATLWPGQDPIGKRVMLAEFAGQKDASGRPRWQTVVGVVKDVHYRGVTDVRLDVYVPAAQSSQQVQHLLVRTTGDPLTLVEPIRRIAHDMDAGVLIQDVETLPQIVYDATRVWRLTRTIAIAFGVLAIVIAGVGLYALLAHAVLARRYELAVRAALGARPVQLSRLVLREALVLAAVAIGVGLMAAIPATRLLESLDVRHVGINAPGLLAVVILLLAVAIIAALLPAVRAANAAPAAVLRQD
jgi:putative ABC transport system permease protein